VQKEFSVRLVVLCVVFVLLVPTAISQPLIEAVKAYDLPRVKSILSSPVDVNQKGAEGLTPLLLAIRARDTHICEELLEHGADPNLKGDSTMTPLMEASLRGTYLIVESLLKKGAQVNVCALMAEGLDGKPLTNPRLMLAGSSPGVDVAEKSALMLAVEGGHIAVARLLLDHGADVNKQARWFITTPDARYSTEGRTVLMCAMPQRFPALVKLLLERKADVNVQERATAMLGTSDGFEIRGDRESMGHPLFVKHSTALHLAAELCDKVSAGLLLEAGANLEIRDGTNSTPLITAIKNGCTPIAEVLIEKGADVNAGKDTPSSPLILAAERGRIRLADILIKAGASINQKAGETGVPLLSWAVIGGSTLVVRNLLEHGAMVDATTNDNSTPLMIAAERGETDIVRLLVSWKAKVNLKNNQGQTALIIATRKGRGVCVKALLRSGADGTIRDNTGKTALAHALEDGDQKIVRLLREGGTAYPATRSIENDRLSDLIEHFSSEIDAHNYSVFQYLAFSKPYGKWDVRPLHLSSLPGPEGDDNIRPTEVPGFVWGVVANHDYELPQESVHNVAKEFIKEGFTHKQRYCQNLYPSRRAALIALCQGAEQNSRSIYVQQKELANGEGYERVDNIYRQKGVYWRYVIPPGSPFQMSPRADTLRGYQYSPRDESILQGLSQAGCYCMVKVNGYLVFLTGGLLDSSIGFIYGKPRPRPGSLGPLFNLALVEELGDDFYYYVSH
jgi:ankyrin repeat protein